MSTIITNKDYIIKKNTINYERFHYPFKDIRNNMIFNKLFKDTNNNVTDFFGGDTDTLIALRSDPQVADLNVRAGCH